MTKYDQLQTVLDKMYEASNNPDKEEAHWDADMLLLDALMVLATTTKHAMIGEIIEVYRHVGKWYA